MDTNDYDKALAAAGALPAVDQARLIDSLWAASASPLSEAWLAEVSRRSAELDQGGVETVSWETVRDAALDRIGRKREP